MLNEGGILRSLKFERFGIVKTLILASKMLRYFITFGELFLSVVPINAVSYIE